jgi:DNA-binding ferritin-like protein
MTFSGSSLPDPTANEVSEVTLVVQQEPEANADGLILKLIDLSSFCHQLYAQAHLAHLNIECANFLALHKFLKKQYEAHVEQVDALGELVRSMDYLMPMCQRGLLGAHKKFDHIKSHDAREMLVTYVRNLEKAGFEAKDVGEYARQVKAPDIENYCAELVGAMFKAAWFLKDSLR